MYCKNCGTFLEDTAAFCSNCGTPTAAPAAPAAPVYEAPAAPVVEAPAAEPYVAPAPYEAPVAEPAPYAAAPYEAPAAEPAPYAAAPYEAPVAEPAPYAAAPYEAPVYQAPAAVPYEAPYQAPVYAAPQAPVTSAAPESLATNILVFGILGLAFACTFWLAVAGIIFSKITQNKVAEFLRCGGVLSGKSKIGHIFSKVAFPLSLVLAIIATIVFIAMLAGA